MFKGFLFKTVFILLVIVGVLYFLEVKLYLTWTIWWYDMLLHFLAGGAVGIATLIFLQKFYNIESSGVINIVLASVIGSLVVGILWEAYELYFEMTSLSDSMNYITDTTSDLILDVTGAFLGALYANKIWSRI